MKFKVLILIIICTIGVTGCFDGPWHDERDVPFRPQEEGDWCGVACIEMWSLFDDRFHGNSQMEIAIWLEQYGEHPVSWGYHAEDLTRCVREFTDSQGYLKKERASNLGQDSCIASSIASIKDFRLSMMPFDKGDHAVLVIGYIWHYDNGQRVADEIIYHDPKKGGHLDLPAGLLKSNYFKPDKRDSTYWVIVGRQKNASDGWDGYQNFVIEGGTFYGGPKVYDPVTWNPYTSY